jgi:hypothetical protein
MLESLAMVCGLTAPSVGGAIRSFDQSDCGKVIGHVAAIKNSQKTGSIEYLFESNDHPDSPQITSIHAGFRSFAGAKPYIKVACPIATLATTTTEFAADGAVVSAQ